jgi:hypothetical protein
MKKNFIAAVDDKYTGRIEEVAERLRERGCDIRQILQLTGVITGKVDLQTSLNDLKIEGIASIELQKKVKKF